MKVRVSELLWLTLIISSLILVLWYLCCFCFRGG